MSPLQLVSHVEQNINMLLAKNMSTKKFLYIKTSGSTISSQACIIWTPAKKKKLGMLFSRQDCSPSDLFNGLQLGKVYSRTELKSQPNRADSDEFALLWHSQSHENSRGIPLGLAFQKKKDNFKMNMNHNRHGRMILPSVTEKRIWRDPSDINSASDSSICNLFKYIYFLFYSFVYFFIALP